MEVAFNMYCMLVARIVRSRFAAMSRRDLRPVLRYFADDALFWYGGDHALSGEYRSKAAIEQWFGRLWGLFEIEFEVHDVLVSGLPSRLRVATRFTAHVRTTDGRHFRNRCMQYAQIRWGKVRADYIYPDTQLLARALDHATGSRSPSYPTASAALR